MKGSRCLAGHGVWAPERARCPVCAGEVAPEDLPDEGELLLATARHGQTVALVRVGQATVPTLVEGPIAEGSRVRLGMRPDGLVVARPIDG